ncbi:25_t:CDS:2 [Diversispora eburnea]|uniref:25_t:CDS:1 n=1 Tax=Diversispora eburnea TaxID=1213867 RepID=A0A9N8W1M7_9GLOM|nr:25_t:CDS:2 [Diversispora eburnea]
MQKDTSEVNSCRKNETLQTEIPCRTTDAYDAEYELDQTINNEESFDTLLKFTIDLSKSNGQKIQAYFKFGIKFEHITLTWLSHIKNEEFKDFLIKLKARYRQDIELLTGAQE